MYRSIGSFLGGSDSKVKSPCSQIVEVYKQFRCKEMVVIDVRGQNSNTVIKWTDQSIFTILLSASSKDVQSVQSSYKTIGLVTQPFTAGLDFVKHAVTILRKGNCLANLHILTDSEALATEFYSICWPQNDKFIYFYLDDKVMKSVIMKLRRYTGPRAAVTVQIIASDRVVNTESVKLVEYLGKDRYEYTRLEETFTMKISFSDMIGGEKSIELMGVENDLIDFNPKKLSYIVPNIVSSWNKFVEDNSMSEVLLIAVTEDVLNMKDLGVTRKTKETKINDFYSDEEVGNYGAGLPETPSWVPMVEKPRTKVKNIAMMKPSEIFPPYTITNYYCYQTILNMCCRGEVKFGSELDSAQVVRLDVPAETYMINFNVIECFEDMGLLEEIWKEKGLYTWRGISLPKITEGKRRTELKWYTEEMIKNGIPVPRIL